MNYLSIVYRGATGGVDGPASSIGVVGSSGISGAGASMSFFLAGVDFFPFPFEMIPGSERWSVRLEILIHS